MHYNTLLLQLITPPKHMSKKRISHSQSNSLWNYTLSPGWQAEEVHVLRLALAKFGVGKWRRILQSKCLPGKSIGQIYMQTQRLIGQQSLGQFMGLHVDLRRVFEDNMKKTGVLRKNNFIINSKDNPNKEERRKMIENNKAKYGLEEKDIKDIRLPKWKCDSLLTLDQIQTDKLTSIQKIHYLTALQQEVVNRINEIKELKAKQKVAKQLV